MSNGPSFSITIPVLNEQDRLEPGVTQLVEAIKKSPEFTEIVIADNGSSDATRDLARGLQKKFPLIKLIELPEKGVGRALSASWTQSQCDIVGYMDVDMATDLKHLVQVQELFYRGAHTVSGSRLLPGANVKNRSALREITSRGFNYILRERLQVHFSDGMCGFKFLQRRIFNEIVQRYSPLDTGWFFNAEILVKSEWLGHPVAEIPVQWSDDRNSRVKILKLTKEYLKQIERIRRQKNAKI